MNMSLDDYIKLCKKKKLMESKLSHAEIITISDDDHHHDDDDGFEYVDTDDDVLLINERNEARFWKNDTQSGTNGRIKIEIFDDEDDDCILLQNNLNIYGKKNSKLDLRDKLNNKKIVGKITSLVNKRNNGNDNEVQATTNKNNMRKKKKYNNRRNFNNFQANGENYMNPNLYKQSGLSCDELNVDGYKTFCLRKQLFSGNFCQYQRNHFNNVNQMSNGEKRKIKKYRNYFNRCRQWQNNYQNKNFLQEALNNNWNNKNNADTDIEMKDLYAGNNNEILTSTPLRNKTFNGNISLIQAIRSLNISEQEINKLSVFDAIGIKPDEITFDNLGTVAKKFYEFYLKLNLNFIHKPVYDMEIFEKICKLQNKSLSENCPGGKLTTKNGPGINCMITPMATNVTFNNRFT